MILPFSAMRAARRALEQDQNRAQQSRLPLWKLVFGEIGVLIRRRGAARVWTTVTVFFVLVLAVEVALSEATPGPALTAVWRWLVAAALTGLTLCGWAVAHAVRRDRSGASARS